MSVSDCMGRVRAGIVVSGAPRTDGDAAEWSDCC